MHIIGYVLSFAHGTQSREILAEVAPPFSRHTPVRLFAADEKQREGSRPSCEGGKLLSRHLTGSTFLTAGLDGLSNYAHVQFTNLLAPRIS